MQTINRLIIVIALLIGQFPTFIQAQYFEGEIVFSKESLEDTSYIIYKIKGDKIRMEELNNQLQPTNYLIVNIAENRYFTLNPKRKIYIETVSYPIKRMNDTTLYIILKTENYKTINGYKCYQWRVRNKKENTEISYWVNQSIFGDFYNVLNILNQRDKNSSYYLQIPDSQGYFPLLTENRSLLREWRMQLKVKSIEPKSMAGNLFEIPQDYKMFQKN